MKPPIICIPGPTAIGKTQLISELATSHNEKFEVISVDSVAIYRHMDVGSAKPSIDEQHAIPYHLINIRNPDQKYSAAEFCADSKTAIEQIQNRGRVPILTGGTMLYFSALLNGMAQIPPIKPESRLQARSYLSNGVLCAHKALAHIDPSLAQRISKHDSQRITRGLEVFFSTGIPLSEWQASTDRSPGLSAHVLRWMPSDRSHLHRSIESRFTSMLNSGFEDEVRDLIKAYPHLDSSYPSMRSIGYREMLEFIHGNIDYDTMVHKSIVSTRRYVKRQLTWLRNWSSSSDVFYDVNSLARYVSSLFS